MMEAKVGTVEQVAITAEAAPVVTIRRRTRKRGQRGSIDKRGSTWRIIYRMPNGKQKWEGGFSSKGAAQDRLTEVLGQIKGNKFVEPTDLTFRQFCDNWMEAEKRNLKPKTWSWYQSALKKWITPQFGDWPICDINRAAVMAFVDSLLSNPKLGRKFVKNTANLLHRVFEKALDREIIAANPARKIEIKTDSDEDGGTLSDDQVAKIREDLTKVLVKLPAPVYQYILIASVLTGARRGELLGLRWEDVDCERGAIHIQKTLQRVPKKMLDGETFKLERLGDTGLALLSPKSKKSRRWIEMGTSLASLFERMKKERNDCQFVFQDEFGKAIDPDRVNKILRAAQKEAGVKFRLHSLRHLHSSLLVQAGANIKQAQARLGHANASTTMNIYSHVLDDESRAFSEKIESALPFVSDSLARNQIKAALPESVK
jgi:integrase